MKCIKLLLIFFLYNSILNSDTILIQKPETIVRESPLIVEAVVTDIKFKQVSNLKWGETIITLSIVKHIVGSCPDQIIIRRWYVTPTLEFLETEWLPTYSLSEELIACLWPTKSGYQTMGLYNGKFTIEDGLIKGTTISKDKFINEIIQIRNNEELFFPVELPRQTTSMLKDNFEDQGKITKVSSAGSHLNGEFITWNFTWDTDYLPISMHYNPTNAPYGAQSVTAVANFASIAYNLWSDQYSFLTINNHSPFQTSEGLADDDFSVILWLELTDKNDLARTEQYPNNPSFFGPNSNVGVDIIFNNDINGTWYFGSTVPTSHNSSQIDFIES